ncbi:acyltransferase family protein [Polaribacter sp. Asnod1-A03]|uniref:acyltransferase family protein n=1 Tax=Polaribacter sp. Asnod1-A03 TaxID=3160581 RepID=UPI00386A3598
MAENKNRIEGVDLLKGITILLVVIYHLGIFYGLSDIIRMYVGPFFMQLFFFVSGLFFSTKKSFKLFFWNKVNRLIIPLLFFYLLNYFVGFLASYFFSSSPLVDEFSYASLLDLFNGNEYFTYSGALWFLACLTNAYFLMYLIFLIKNEVLKFLVVISLSLIGYYLGVNKIDLPYFIDSSLTVILFFYLGTILKNNIDTIINKYSQTYLLLIFYALFIVSIFIFDDELLLMKNYIDGNYFVIVLTAIIGIFSHFLICVKINKIKIINFLGKNSLIILGTHQVLIVLFKLILNQFSFLNNVSALIINLLCIVVIEIFIINFLNRFLPHFVGGKDIIKI